MAGASPALRLAHAAVLVAGLAQLIALGVSDFLQPRRLALQRPVYELPYGPKRMILRHPLRRRDGAEDRFRLLQFSSIPSSAVGCEVTLRCTTAISGLFQQPARD